MKNKFVLLFISIILIGMFFIFSCTTPGSSSGGGSGSSGGSSDKKAGFQNIWSNLNPSVKPSARYGHSIIYAGNNKIILFGGSYSFGSYDNETWEYDISSNTWLNLSPSGPVPSARGFFSMVYIGNNKVILFGGRDSTGLNGETWEYNISSNTWMNLTPVIKPSARMGHIIVYMEDYNRIILFGGYDGYSYTDETWEYNVTINSWSNLNPTVKPSARESHSMVYIGNSKVILFGGRNGSSNNETWEYDFVLNTWTNLNPTAKPTARCFHSMSFVGNNKIILFGGNDGNNNNETWEYNVTSNIWTNLNPIIKPSARISPSISYIGNNKIILFGGDDGSNNNETWIYR
jgi:hypothetical protein